MLRLSAALVLSAALIAGCDTTITYSDLTHSGRGIDQLQMDAGTCQMQLQNSSLGQPVAASSNIGTTLTAVGAQITAQQNFFDSCMLSHGWHQVANTAPQPARQAFVAPRAPAPPSASDSSVPVAELERKARLLVTEGFYPDAMKWCRLAADRGDALCMRSIGSMYAKGLGVPVDYVEAMRWSRKAADQGDVEADYNIGVLYMNGSGVPKDDSQAMQSFRKAADKGYAAAATNLGLLYSTSLSIPRDYAEAMLWFERAGNQHEPNAENNIGWLYANGLGVVKNCGTARQRLDKAVATGLQSAKDNLASGYSGACRW
jgi:Sel1 repeat